MTLLINNDQILGSSLASSQNHGSHIGYTTELEPLLFDLALTSGSPQVALNYQKPDGRNAFLLDQAGDETMQSINFSLIQELDNLVGHHGYPLVRGFRKLINRNFPIIENAFFNAYEYSPRHALDPALLATVYTLAAATLSYRSNSYLYFDTAKIEEIAYRSFSHSLSKPTLSTIQTGILLMQRPEVDSKNLNSQLIGAAYELGLHLDCSKWVMSDSERALRKRLAWALYMQDKWCSLNHGRPSLIPQNNWAVPKLGEEDFADTYDCGEGGNSLEEIQRGVHLFMQLVALTEILSTVLDTFYTLTALQEVDAAGADGTRLILERAKPVQIRLKEWFTKLPRHLKMDHEVQGKPSSTGTLHSLSQALCHLH